MTAHSPYVILSYLIVMTKIIDIFLVNKPIIMCTLKIRR